MAKDYLVNINKKNGKLLFVDENLSFEFDDVSKIDKITSHMREDELKKSLKVYNEKLLRGKIFILETTNDNSKGYMYRPFINESTSKSEKYLYRFDDYIDERIKRVNDKSSDRKVKLELAQTPEFYEFTNEMLDDLMRGYINKSLYVYEALSVRSLIPDDLVKHMVKVIDEYDSLSLKNKEKELVHIGRSLSGYRALRNFLMEYIKFKNEEYGGLNRPMYLCCNKFDKGKYYINDSRLDIIQEDIKVKKLKCEKIY